MTAGTWAMVAVFGAAGALLRHEVTTRADDALVALHATNVVGAFALGLVVGAQPQSPAVWAFGLGGLGALTSFSTWMVGVRERQRPAIHLLARLALAVAAAVAGTLLGRSLA